MGVIVEACWKGYKQAGLKKKGDRMVPNCVPISEDINIPINVGDTVLGGKFKNKRIVVKSISKNEKGDITINGKPLLKFRMVQEGEDVIGICEMGCGPRKKGESEADYKKRCGGYTYAFPLYMSSKEEPQEEPTTPPSDSETPAETPTDGGIEEANAVTGGKIHKFITGKNLTLKGKKYADIEFEVVSTDNKSELVRLRILFPLNLAGQEMNVPFKTIRRGPFIKTQTKGVFETIKKVDGKYVVYPKKGGDRLGTHDSYEAALKQLQAIEASKARRNEDWSDKYKRSIDCNNPKGFSQKAHCQGRKKNELQQLEEDLRNWFGKGKTGSSDGGGWDRYGTDGQKLGKCGDGDEGDAYAACLSKEKAAKLGPEGRAAFVRRKRADQKKAGDAKKGGEQKKGQKPTFSKTGASEGVINENIIANILIKLIVSAGVVVVRVFWNLFVDRVVDGAIRTYHDIKDIVAPEPYIKFLKGLAKNDAFNKQFIQFAIENKKGKNLIGNSWIEKVTTLPAFIETFDRFTKDEGIDGSNKTRLLAVIKKSMWDTYLRNWKGIYQMLKKKYPQLANELPEGKINEIPMADLQKIDQFADKQLNPLDIVITDKHFFDRLNDPRNGKEISQAELIGFFKRLGKNKKQFLDFLDKYQEMVAVDDRTNINIPFMKQANKAIAKTIMRKKDFKSSTPKLDI
jgi:hypothetical protein